MRWLVIPALVAVVVLAGCGSSSRTFGQAAEEWCGAHYGQNDDAEERCFEVVISKGATFLEQIERGEQIKLEALRLRAEH